MAIPQAVREQAVEWLIELQSATASDDTRRRWQQWRDADPVHAQAWARVEAFGDRLQALPQHIALATLNAPASAASPMRRKAVKRLALLIGAGGTAWLAAEQSAWREWAADRRTGVGQRSLLVLDDGTRVHLNADTVLNLRYSATERKLQLLRGDILIITAPDPAAASGGAARPFSVDTIDGNVQVLGTRFMLGQRDGRSAVAVFSGAVRITPARGGAALRLDAGQQAAYTGVGAGPVTPANEAVTAWVDGMLVAQDMPLAEFLAALSPYHAGRLHCSAAAMRLTVSGTYPLADSDKVLDMLRTTLPLTVSRYTRYWTTVDLKK